MYAFEQSEKGIDFKMAKKDNEKKQEKKQKRHYFKDMKAELKKVIWPTPKQLVNNTLAVIAFTLIAAVIVFVLDLCFDSINKYAIVPLQERIQEAYSTSSEEETSNETENQEENVTDDSSVEVEVENGVEDTSSENTSSENTSNENNSEANVEE